MLERMRVLFPCFFPASTVSLHLDLHLPPTACAFAVSRGRAAVIEAMCERCGVFITSYSYTRRVQAQIKICQNCLAGFLTK